MAKEGSFRAMLDAATKRSAEADSDWRRDPGTKVLMGGRMVTREPKPFVPEVVEEKPKPADWGSW